MKDALAISGNQVGAQGAAVGQLAFDVSQSGGAILELVARSATAQS